MKINYEDEGYTPFTQNTLGETESFKNLNLEGYDIGNDDSVPGNYYMMNAGFAFKDDIGFSGWKVVKDEGGHPRLSLIFETSWYHSVQPEPRKYIGGPFRCAIGDYALGASALFGNRKFCPMTELRVTYEKAVKIGECLETLVTDVDIEDNICKQEAIQRVYGTDKIVGRLWSTHIIPENKKKDG